MHTTPLHDLNLADATLRASLSRAHGLTQSQSICLEAKMHVIAYYGTNYGNVREVVVSYDINIAFELGMMNCQHMHHQGLQVAAYPYTSPAKAFLPFCWGVPCVHQPPNHSPSQIPGSSWT